MPGSRSTDDWSSLDAVLEAAHAKGKRVAPRLLTNEGDYGQATPQWVFASRRRGRRSMR